MDLGFDDPTVLDQLSRKELQGLAKRHKIKANAKVEAVASLSLSPPSPSPGLHVCPWPIGCHLNCKFGVLAESRGPPR